ncbi:DNA-directed RNA polymerase III subunit RPC3 [Taenia crassiceps]|uniref:DNA-directed RNA polymerase III subunit RPC3 n=1 Tax=Taenia crassiceps TaxID=6207 RepID=A0ABR4QNH2_9CEST
MSDALAALSIFLVNKTLTLRAPIAHQVNQGDVLKIPIMCKLGFLFYGAVAENLLLILFVSGMAKSSEVLRATLLRVSKGVKYKEIEVLVDCLDTLVGSGIIRASTKSMILQPPEEGVQYERFSLAKSDLLENLRKFVASGATYKNFHRLLPNPKQSVEWDLILAPRVDSLEALWRDYLISRFAAERIDETAGDIMSHILHVAFASKEHGHVMSPSSEAVDRSQVAQSFSDPPDHFNSYLTLLLNDSMSLLEQKPGIAGGIYICPYKKVVRGILVSHIENVVQVLFENAGLRIFRILLIEGYLSYETLERRLLIPQKEFRRILPQMVASRFVSITEFSRAKDFNADTVVCLYSVNLSTVARLVIEYAQHCVLCLVTRLDAELNAKSRLIDQRYRVESMISKHQEEITKLEGQKGVSGEAVEEIESHKESVQALQNSLTPSEINQLSTLSNRLAKLAAAQWEAETAWFVADLYLRLYFDTEE